MKVKISILLLSFFLLSGCESEAPEGKLTVGSKAPSLRTKYLEDVGGDMSKLTSYRYPDERMYQYSLDKALALGKPMVVEFATPGHCTVCDKQLQMLKALVTKYGKEVIFLHMDQYKNPEAFISYKVKGDPWTFVIDASGKVKFRQAGRMLYNELDYQITKVVPEQQEQTGDA
ncbi:MAG: thioredoxin family protein [Gammaproteobacteria bacterium]|nr:thioredoxin family protein [Gammaproteobacteria bacterium]MDH5694023.1 thioredoxin family protein [Gammaproteobacteria bacterium]